MATGIRNIDPESTRALLDTFPDLSEGPDGYVQVEEEHLSIIKNCVTDDVGAEAASAELEPLVAIEDLADAATDGLDDSDLDFSHLIGFTREKSTIKRVTPARLCAKDEQPLLVIGSLQIPVVQDGKELSVGRLKANAAEDYEKVSRPIKDGEIHFHFIRFQDEESKDYFDVSAYVLQTLEADAVKPHLKAGEPLGEILSAPGGGGAMRLNDFITEETPLPWTGKLQSLNVRDSDSQYAIDGKSYSVTTEDGVTLYLRGTAEKDAAGRRDKIEADLAKKSGSWELKVLSRKEVDGKVRMVTKLVSTSRQGLFQQKLAEAKAKPAAELPAAEAETAEPAKASASKRRNAFAKK